MIAQSSIVTAQAAVAINDAALLLRQMTVLAALDIEGFAANTSPYHKAVGEARPYPGYQRTLASLRLLLEHGAAASATPPRHLQAPLSFRTCGGVLGACGDALDYCESMVRVELNAHQQNPLCIEAEDRVQSCGNFEMQALATTLDLARIALAPCLTSQVERSIKLLQASQSGLTDGLQPRGEDVATGHGLSGMAWVLQVRVYACLRGLTCARLHFRAVVAGPQCPTMRSPVLHVPTQHTRLCICGSSYVRMTALWTYMAIAWGVSLRVNSGLVTFGAAFPRRCVWHSRWPVRQGCWHNLYQRKLRRRKPRVSKTE